MVIAALNLGQLGRHLRVARPVVMLGGDLLPFGGVEVLQVLLGHLAGAVLVDHLVDHGHRRFGQDAHRTGPRSRTCPAPVP